MKNKKMLLLLLLTILSLGIASETAISKNYVAGDGDIPIYIGRSIRV
jgi:hypothetical protein